jgi:hypothetical protein
MPLDAAIERTTPGGESGTESIAAGASEQPPLRHD